MALNNAQKIFNLIRLKASKMYQDEVPALTDKSPIGDVGTPILTNPLVFKEFSILLGALMRVEVLKRAWTNPLAELIRGNGSPLGEYSMEIANNPVAPRPYEPTRPEKVLEYAMLDDKVSYYARNVKEVFKVSIAYQDMQGAFQSYDKFNDYVAMKMASLTSGQQLSQFNHIFESIVANYNAGLFVKSPVHIGAGLNNYADFTVAVKNAIDLFQYPSTQFNRYGQLAGANGDFRGWCTADDIIVIARIDWINESTVNFLASQFNLDKAEIGKRIIKVPDFGYDLYDDNGKRLEHITTPITAMVCDRKLFNFSTDLEIDDSFYNPETLVQNHYKHWWATYSCSPFANCLVFTNETTDDFDYSVNNYNARYRYPASINLKNISGASKNVTSDFSIYGDVTSTLAEMYDSNGNVIPFPDDITVISPETTALFINLVMTSSDIVSSMPTGTIVVSDSTLESDISLLEYVSHTEAIDNGEEFKMDIKRLNNRNYLVPFTINVSEEVVMEVTQEDIDEFIAKYGENCYLRINHIFLSNGNKYETPVYVGVKNSAIIGVLNK